MIAPELPTIEPAPPHRTTGYFSAVFAVLLALAVLPLPAPAVAQHAGHGQHGEHDQHQVHGQHEDHDDHAKHRAALSAEPSAREVRDLDLPQVRVVTEEGEEVDFYADLVQDQVVAISFIFTTCRTICPPIGANFGKLQEALGDRVGDEIRLISVSVDPVTDTPQRLKAWGESFGAGPGWTLVTGDKPEVDKLLKALEVFTPEYEDHTPTLLLGNDATGEWTRTYGLTPPDQLATMLGELAEGKDAAEVAKEVSE